MDVPWGFVYSESDGLGWLYCELCADTISIVSPSDIASIAVEHDVTHHVGDPARYARLFPPPRD